MEIQKYQQIGLQVAEKLQIKPVQSVDQALDNTRTISILRKENNTEVKIWLLYQVAKLSEYVDAKKRLQGTEQYQMAVDALLEYAPSWTPEDFLLFFQKIIRGQYKIYERLKIAELLEFASQYEQLKCDARRKAREQEEYNHTIKPKDVVYVPEKRSSRNNFENIDISKYIAEHKDFLGLTDEEVKELKKKSE